MTAGPSQLKMLRAALDPLPDAPAPEGVRLRPFAPGDEPGIARVHAASELGAGTVEDVRTRLLAHPSFRPERLIVAERLGEIVGTAAAWIDRDDPTTGFLHMLGTLAEHRGRGLGASLVVATLRRHRSEGLARQWLRTDEWREDAVRLYLRLGYRPLHYDASHPARWAALLGRLGRPELADEAAWGSA